MSFPENESDADYKNSNNKMCNNSDFNCHHPNNVHTATVAEEHLQSA
jgi:hypothetical protein